MMIRSDTPTYYEKLSLLVLFQNKWCHSTHLKLNNRSDGSSVYLTAAVRVITKDASGVLTQPYQSLYELSVSQYHPDLEADFAFHGLLRGTISQIKDTVTGFVVAASLCS